MRFFFEWFRRFFFFHEKYYKIRPQISRSSSLEKWREQYFSFLLTFSVLIGGLTIIFSFPMFIKEEAWVFGLLSCLSYAVLVSLLLNTQVSKTVRVVAVLFLIYAIGLLSWYQLGLVGNCRVWFLMFSIFSGLFLGLKAGIGSLFINAITLFLLVSSGREEFMSANGSSISSEFIISTVTVFFVINAIVTISLVSLIRSLEILLNKQLRWQQFIESLNDMVYFQGLSGELSYLNKANEQITGYTIREFEENPKLWMNIVHPDDVKVAEDFFKKHPEGVESYDTIYRLKTKEGDWRWILSRMVGVLDESGKYIGYNCLDRDITEFRKAEQLSDERQKLYQTLFEQASDGILVENEQQIIVDVNTRFCDMSGFKRSELLMMKSTDLAISTERESPQELYTNKNYPNTVFYSGRLLRSSGESIMVEISLTRIHFVDNTFYLSIIRDVTETRNTQEKIRKHADFIQLLYDAGRKVTHSLEPQTIYTSFFELLKSVIPIDGVYFSSYDDENELITCTAAWQDDKKLNTDNFPPLHLEAERKGSQSLVIRSGQSIVIDDYEKQIKTATQRKYVSVDSEILDEVSDDEAEVTQSAMIVPMKLENKVVGVIQVFSYKLNAYSAADLALLESLSLQVAVALANAYLYNKIRKANKELDEERTLLSQRVLERTDELHRANMELATLSKMKDEFLANMSHELRTPLNAVLGISESLQDIAFGDLNEKQMKGLKSIEESGRHLLTMINDMLDLSKITAGKINLEFGVHSVQQICESALRFHKKSAFQKRIQLKQEIVGLIPDVYADGKRLLQILVNLLSNAVKFTNDGGEAGLIVAYHKESNEIAFTVWDTGIGFPMEEKETIFEPFTQLDSSMARKYEGPGLGLSLTKKLVELHKGRIVVNSEIGRGSEFSVFVPLLSPEY